MAEKTLAQPLTPTVDHQLREIADQLQGLMMLSTTAGLDRLQHIENLFYERLQQAKRLGYRARFVPGPRGFVVVEWEAL